MKDLIQINSINKVPNFTDGNAKINNGESDLTGFERIAIPILNGHEVIKVKNIIRCEANGNYTTIYCIEDKKFIISRHLKELELALSSGGFLRLHHSHIINPIYIQRILKSDGGTVVLTDGKKIRISKNKQNILHLLFDEILKL